MMRIYFLSSRKAILKLNGLYAGGVDAFERHIEVDLGDKIMAEITPGDGSGTLSFFLDDSLLTSPPPALDCYVLGDELLVYARSFPPQDTRLRVLYQKRFSGNLVTVFEMGERYLSVDGGEYGLYPLGGGAKPQAEEKNIAGYPVLALRWGTTLVLISHTGKLVYSGETEEAEFGDTFKTKVPFSTCARVCAECEYAYDGEKLTLISSAAKESAPVGEKLMHFAFFESVLLSADCEKYLSPDLRARAGEIKQYLGNFTGVSVPTEAFCLAHPDLSAAGLIYPRSKNLFEVKYFYADIKGGKIDNIAPVE